MNRNNRGMTASTPPHNSAPAGDAPDVVYPTLGQMRLRGHLDYTVIGNDCHYLNDGNRRYLAVGPLDDEGPLATRERTRSRGRAASGPVHFWRWR